MRVTAADRENVERWIRSAELGRANRYHPFHPRGLYAQSYMREHFVRVIVENDVPLDEMDILDIGCGDGAWCRYFAELKGTVDGIVGVDLSDERLAIARGLSPIEYVRGDMTNLHTFLDRPFDFVSAFVSLMFLRDAGELRSVLSSVYGLVRPGGYFFVYEQEQEHDPDADFSGWSRRQIVAAGTSAGFEIVVQRPLYKMLLGRAHPIEGMSFKRMAWHRAAESVVPGRWAYYAVLFRRPRTKDG
jgi:SAM-dependent methyltransferase